MKEKYIIAHMEAAYVYAKLSSCKRRKVGCVIVKENNNIIAIGYNGTPPGSDNCCEDGDGRTKPTVIHAEDNALRKLTSSTESARGSTMFITTAPCIICAPRIVDADVKRVIYDEIYHNSDGIDYLKSKKIEVLQYSSAINKNNKNNKRNYPCQENVNLIQYLKTLLLRRFGKQHIKTIMTKQ